MTKFSQQPAHGFKKRSQGLVGVLRRWKTKAKELKRNTHALYWAVRDPRVPWYAKAVAVVVIGYALSPIDLIPDFIPVLGYLDDLLLLPLGIALAIRMIPAAIFREAQQRAEAEFQAQRPKSWVAAGIIIILWVIAVGYVLFTIGRKLALF